MGMRYSITSKAAVTLPRLLGTALLVTAGFVSVSVNAATVIGVDSGYYRFGLDTVGAEVVGRPAEDGLLASDGSPFTFSAASNVLLKIVDLQLSVDRFQVFINDVDVGLTSAQTEGASVGLDVAAALADERFSRGIYRLAAGDYSVRVLLAEGQFLPGSGAIGVSSVPEPGTLALLGLGLAGLAVGRRRRQ